MAADSRIDPEAVETEEAAQHGRGGLQRPHAVGQRPVVLPASTTGSQRRTDSRSPERAAAQAAQCAASGLAAIRSSPSERIHPRTVATRPEST